MDKVNIIGTVGDAFAELKSKLKEFLLHTFIKRKQAAQMDKMIAQCDTENIVLQVDFSENATIASQHEIQSAHWSHGQATLFTSYAWIDKEEKVNKSFVVISDELTHTKHAVYIFIDYIFKVLTITFSTIKKINVFSDGAGSQFKQRPNVLVHYIPKEDIAAVKQQLDTHWEGVLVVPMTHQRHCYIPKGRNQMMVADISDATEFTMVTIRLNAVEDTEEDEESEEEVNEEEEDAAEQAAVEDAVPLSLAIGQWVIVTYEGGNYPGKITSCDHDDMQVNVIHKSGKYWKWPNPNDKIFYRPENIIRRITPPKVVGSRGQFVFMDHI